MAKSVCTYVSFTKAEIHIVQKILISAKLTGVPLIPVKKKQVKKINYLNYLNTQLLSFPCYYLLLLLKLPYIVEKTTFPIKQTKVA